MKLSEIKGEETLDVIADLVGPISRIAQDDDAMAIFKTKVAEGEDKRKAMLANVQKSLPALLKTHKEDLIEILAIVNRTTVQEYKASLTMAKLLKDVSEILMDEELLDFLA